MKKLLQVLFSCIVIISFAQKNQFIELKSNIKDKNHIAQSLTLLDRRDDKTMGIISHRKEPLK